jgi:Reverse transcriptase (RNA-dependent DNA polymerase).
MLHVFYKGVRFRTFVATTGVPQGAILGTLLFTIFINDLASLLGPDSLLFADDVKLVGSIESYGDVDKLQGQLNKLSEWCIANKLSLNIGK